ncbi:MAG TPA: hypothetical protein VHY79_12515 [Rhizomicrobium sp.]|jgi:hypothetical protein|nr:hypothetical protein [Rhizomicrobium sp.]
MIRKVLFVTTAIVAVGTLSFFAAQSAAVARPVTAIIGRDRNREFLCTYGQLKVSQFESEDESSLFSAWTHVAVPFVGRGQTIHGIIIKQAHGSSTMSAQFSAGIYSNTPSGFPGKRLARGTALAPATCLDVKFPIKPTTLKRGATYWIEETAPPPNHSTNSTYLAVAPHKSKRRAYVQTHYYSNNASSQITSSTSPWIPQSVDLHVRLR